MRTDVAGIYGKCSAIEMWKGAPLPKTVDSSPNPIMLLESSIHSIVLKYLIGYVSKIREIY